MSKTNLTSVPIPNVSKEFALRLVQSFPRLNITPASKTEDIMFNAGQQKVVDFVMQAANLTLEDITKPSRFP